MQCKDTPSSVSSPVLPNSAAVESNTQDLATDSKSIASLSSTDTASNYFVSSTQEQPSGTTCEPSEDTQGNTLSWWGEALAKTTLTPIPRAKDLREVALGFGGNSSELSKNADPQLCYGKTPQDADLSRSVPSLLLEWFSGRLSPAGIVVSGSQYELVMLERPTKGIASLLLPTPLTCSSDSELYRRPGRDKLETRLRLLPTPVASDAKTNRISKNGASLDTTLKLLPTPVARDLKGKGFKGQLETTLIPLIPKGYVSHPRVREWMLGLEENSTAITETDGGALIPLMGLSQSLSEASLIEAIALPHLETPALPSKLPSVGNTSTTSPNALSLACLQSELTEIQQQIDVAATTKDAFPKKSAEYKLLDKHGKAEWKRLQDCIKRANQLAALRGKELLMVGQPAGKDGWHYQFSFQEKTTGENTMFAIAKTAKKIDDLAAEIANQQAQLQQIHLAYTKDEQAFKDRKLTKNSREWKSAIRAYESTTSGIKNLIERLMLCQSLPVETTVTHECYGDGILKGFLFDDRAVVMASVSFIERGMMDVAPHTIKVAEPAKNTKKTPLPKPVSVGDVVIRPTGEVYGEVKVVQVRGLAIQREDEIVKLTWDEFELLRLSKQNAEQQTTSNGTEITTAQNETESAESSAPIKLHNRTEEGIESPWIVGQWVCGIGDSVEMIETKINQGEVEDISVARIDLVKGDEVEVTWLAGLGVSRRTYSTRHLISIRREFWAYLEEELAQAKTELEEEIEVTREVIDASVEKLRANLYSSCEVVEEKPEASGEQNQLEVPESLAVTEVFRRTESPTPVEIAGTSDDDEVERIVEKIKDLDRSHEVEVVRHRMEVGRQLFRLQQVWKPSEQFPSLTEFCTVKIDRRYGKSYRNELIKAAQANDLLASGTSVRLPSINAARPITKMINKGVEPEKIQKLVQEVANTGEVTPARIEQAAQKQGLLPQKAAKPITKVKQEVAVTGQSLGLSGREPQQLPDIEPNAGIPPINEPTALYNCCSRAELRVFCKEHTQEAIAQLRSLDWERRFELRGIWTEFEAWLATCAFHKQIDSQGILTLEAVDSKAKIKWLEAEVARLQGENDELKKKASQATELENQLSVRRSWLNGDRFKVRMDANINPDLEYLLCQRGTIQDVNCTKAIAQMDADVNIESHEATVKLEWLEPIA
jgi:hypothetical protein